MGTLLISSVAELDEHVQFVRDAAERSVRSLRNILASEDESLQVLRLMKFSPIGHHPTENRALNLVEQINQTFTYLASFEAARWLFTTHAGAGGFSINLGTSSGFDLESQIPGLVAAEVFTATHPGSNNKLRKDLDRLAEKASSYQHRYVFFSCPQFATARQPQLERGDGTQVWSFSVDQLSRSER